MTLTLPLALAMSLGLASPPEAAQIAPQTPDFRSWSSELLYLRLARNICRQKIAVLGIPLGIGGAAMMVKGAGDLDAREVLAGGASKSRLPLRGGGVDIAAFSALVIGAGAGCSASLGRRIEQLEATGRTLNFGPPRWGTSEWSSFLERQAAQRRNAVQAMAIGTGIAGVGGAMIAAHHTAPDEQGVSRLGPGAAPLLVGSLAVAYGAYIWVDSRLTMSALLGQRPAPRTISFEIVPTGFRGAQGQFAIRF